MPRKQKNPTIKFEVTITRQIEYHATVEVEATNADDAKAKAADIVDNKNPYANRWVEGDVIDETVKVKVVS